MPKVKSMMSAKEKQEEAVSKTKTQIKEEIGRILGKYDMTKSEFAKEAGIAESTFYRRWRNFGELTVEEIEKIRYRFKEFNLAR